MLDSTPQHYQELPTLPELMKELTKPIPGETKGDKLSAPRSIIKGIVITNLIPLLFIAVAIFCGCVLKFKWELHGGYGFIKNYGVVIIDLLYIGAIGQVLFQVVAMMRPYRKLSVHSASWIETQYERERALAQRLSHIRTKVLEECRRRVEMEIDMQKQISSFAMVVSAVGGLGQLHFGSPPYLEGALIGVMVFVVCEMRMIRQYSRLAFVLTSAEKAFSS